jgi:hypothetical protein
MKQFKTLLTQLLLVTSLLLPWSAAEAVKGFEASGHLNEMGYDTFVIRGQKYRLASDARLDSDSSSRRSFRDFRKGDFIYFKGKILNGVYYVDIIYYETPEAS